MEHHEHETTLKKRLQIFMPLIIIFSIIIIFTLIKQLYTGWDLHGAMYDFMGSFFVVFGGFKIINLRGFADAYSTYDIIAQRSRIYAYMYPFIELTLGILYLIRIFLTPANIVTFVLMGVSSIGVFKALARKQSIVCACLGTVFKIPMTYVTLLEDILMAVMAAIMLYLAL